jgi:predicted hydrocarbon binding protein
LQLTKLAQETRIIVTKGSKQAAGRSSDEGKGGRFPPMGGKRRSAVSEYTEMSGEATYQYGNIALDRGEIGLDMPVLFFRIFEAAVRDRLSKEYSLAYAFTLMRDAGKSAGAAFAEEFLPEEDDAEAFLRSFRSLFKALGYGALEIERADMSRLSFVFSLEGSLEPARKISEGETDCVFTEGFLSGALSSHFGTDVNVKEIECRAGGALRCRYIAGIDV